MTELLDETGRLFVITGIGGAGKTTIGRELAGALPRAVFIDGDTIAGVVVSGAVPMTEPPKLAAIEQLLLRFAGALTLADVYRNAGFDVVIADTVIGCYLDDFLELADPEPVHLVVLHPSVEVITERDAARRHKTDHDGATLDGQWLALEHETERLGLWIDSSHHSVAKTVTHILRNLDEALIVPAG
ncbi:AAA family ATPase [Yimella sp. cx-51]|uniref:AAA family ATPase n=1 Tax=Yimella sp. cx-51 TaxID=2770551 RepID=UPI00165EA08B|nr:AAA family ATPase [Yimella sp. cx-51]MBC9957054.1 AAA family ATPase [Yimella sp. cx-51]QTH37280.1 AAA family ATPase [Yimella sp. cx-51]